MLECGYQDWGEVIDVGSVVVQETACCKKDVGCRMLDVGSWRVQ